MQGVQQGLGFFSSCPTSCLAKSGPQRNDGNRHKTSRGRESATEIERLQRAGLG
jgi:hypothetical protein